MSDKASQRLRTELDRLNLQFIRESGGHQAFLYTHRPDRSTWYAFTDGTDAPSLVAAVEHMRGLLDDLQHGRPLWW